MALVVLPEGTQISGSIGGTTWSHNRYGAYKRNRSIPVNPNTDRQVSIRNKLRALAIAWQITLTQAQRDAWDAYAANVIWQSALGQAIHLTGLNHYIRTNVDRLTLTGVRLDDAPTVNDIGTAEQSLACSASEATQNLSFTFDDTAAWATEDGGFQIFFMGIPKNSSIKFFGGPWRYVGGLLGQTTPNGEPSSPYDRPAAWPIAENHRIWVRSRVERADGRLSEFARFNFLCGA